MRAVLGNIGWSVLWQYKNQIRASFPQYGSRKLGQWGVDYMALGQNMFTLKLPVFVTKSSQLMAKHGSSKNTISRFLVRWLFIEHLKWWTSFDLNHNKEWKWQRLNESFSKRKTDRPLSFSWTFERKETLSFNQQDYPWVLFKFLSIPVKVKHIRNSWISTIHIISKPHYGWTAVFFILFYWPLVRS